MFELEDSKMHFITIHRPLYLKLNVCSCIVNLHCFVSTLPGDLNQPPEVLVDTSSSSLGTNVEKTLKITFYYQEMDMI